MKGDKVCFYCGDEDDRVPKLIQEDHVFGREIDPQIVYACLNCHSKKTYYQNKLPPTKRKDKDMMFVSTGATLIVVGENIMKLGGIDLND